MPLVSGFNAPHEADKGLRLTKEQIKHFRLWNYIAITRNAQKAAQYPPQVGMMGAATAGSTVRQLSHKQRKFVRQSLGVDDLTPVADGNALLQLLRRVNDVDWWQPFCEEMLMFWQLTGAIYIWVITDGLGLPAELWVIPTQWIKPIYDRNNRQTGWKVTPENDDRNAIDLSMAEVIFSQKKSPHSKSQPFSPTDAASSWILNSEEIERARSEFYKRGVLSPLAMTFDPQLYPKDPGEEMLRRVERKFMNRYGGTRNAYKIPAIPPGVTLTPIGNKPDDMDMGESADSARDAILAVHGTPKSAAGLADDYNRANIFGSNLIWCEHVIMPMLQHLGGFFTEKLAPRFGANLVVWFDDCRPNDTEEERAETQLDFEMGALTPRQRAEQRGLEPPEGEAADKTFIRIGYTPLEDFNDSLEERTPDQLDPNADGPGGGNGSDADDPDSDDDDPDADAGGDDTQSQSFGCPSHGEIDPVRLSPRQRRILRTFDRLLQALERNAQASVKRLWRRLKRQAVRNVKAMSGPEGATSEMILPQASMRNGINRTMRQHWQRGAETGATFEIDIDGIDLEADAVRQAEGDNPLGIAFPDMLSEKLRDYVGAQEEGVWAAVDTTVRAKLDAAIIDAIESGAGRDGLIEAVEGVMDSRINNAEQFAQTQMTGAMNNGQQAVREHYGIDRKEWIATFDQYTRDSHLDADGQIVDNGDAFEVGGSRLMHPGDYSLGADPKEVERCRCTAAGVVE